MTEITRPALATSQLAPYWKDACIALSLASLCFAETWARINYGIPLFMPFWSWIDLAALLVNICGLSAVFLLLFHISRTWRWSDLRLHAVLYLIPLFVLANLYRRSHPVAAGLVTGYHQLIAAFGVLGVLAIAVIIRYRRRLVPVIEVLIMGMVVLVPFNFAYAAWTISRQEALPQLAQPLPAKDSNAPRVVWIILDETDWRIAFGQRPASLRLPNFDRLRSDSFFAENAFQAGADTLEAMPALTTGTKVRTASPSGKYTLWLKADPNAKPSNWGHDPNVFSQAHELGYNVGVVGWFLPYCRIFHSSLTACYWESMNTMVRSAEPSFARSLWSQIRALTPMESRFRQLSRYETQLVAGKEMAADPRLGLVLLHLSMPHGPAAYERDRQRFTAWNFRSDWYYDNLALADRALGEIRDFMQQNGEWDRTTVLVSSDHALRPSTMAHPHPDKRVPYLIKVAGQRTGLDYTQPFNARITKDLIVAVLRGDIRSGDDVARWISDHASQPIYAGSGGTD